MPKFEYAEIVVNIGGPLSGTQCDVTLFKVDGKDEKTSGKFGKLIAELGARGWELVAASARTDTGLSGRPMGSMNSTTGPVEVGTLPSSSVKLYDSVSPSRRGSLMVTTASVSGAPGCPSVYERTALGGSDWKLFSPSLQ